MTSRFERLQQADLAAGVECNFNLRDALASEKTHGITTRVGVGISRDPENAGAPALVRYAVCPICQANDPSLGQYYLLQDAQSCVDGHRFVDQSENKRARLLELQKQKAHNVFLHTTMLMSKKYAVISISRTLAENFIRDNGIDAVIVRSTDDLPKVSGFQFLFLGRPTNYLTHPALEDSDVRAELERQECIRDWSHAVYDGKRFLLSDEYDLEDLEGEVFIRKQYRGRPAYVSTKKSIVRNPQA